MSMTPIEAIQPLWTTFPTGERQSAGQGDQSSLFFDIFRSAVDNVKQTEAEKNHTEYLLATGQLDNPADLNIAITKSLMSLELLIQLRNKALEAHSELMRINL